MNMIRLAQKKQTGNSGGESMLNNVSRTLVEMGFDLAAAQLGMAANKTRWLNMAIGQFFDLPYHNVRWEIGWRIEDAISWHANIDEKLSKMSLPEVFQNGRSGGSVEFLRGLALIIGRLPNDIWIKSTSAYVQKADKAAVSALFRNQEFGFAIPEFLRHYGPEHLIALAPKSEARIRCAADQIHGVPDHVLRIDGELVPVRFKTWRGEFGQSLGAIFTCVKTGKVWHQPTGGELQDGPPPAHTQPIPTAGRCSENPARHRAICNNIRAASKGERRDCLPMVASDNGAAYAGQGIPSKKGGLYHNPDYPADETIAVQPGVHRECSKECALLRMAAPDSDLPTTAEELAEIDAAEGVEYDLEPIPSPYFYTDGQLCRRATLDMLRSLWACIASFFRRAA